MTHWLGPDELRIGLGCMRLAEQADETIAAALDAGITVFDTARAYEGNEQLLARALRDADGARIVTKGGMARPNDAWVPDGRAKSIRADCEASLEALGGLEIDLYLLHAPDPRTPWSTSVRALGRLVTDGLVARVGVCNVNRAQLDEAVELAPIEAVQVAISPFDDRALRGGVVDRCSELGITVIAHSPLGGPRRARRLERHEVLTGIARVHDATQAEVALAWLLGLGPNVVADTRRPPARDRPLVGARGDAPSRSRRARAPGPDARQAVAIEGRRRRPRRHGSPRSGQVASRGRVHGTRVPPAQSRRARRLTCGPRPGTRRDARVGVSRGRPRQHVPHPRGAEPRRGDGRALRRPGPLPLARHAARAGAGQPGRAPARAIRRAPVTRAAEGQGACGARSAHPHPADACVPRARAAERRRGFRLGRAHRVRARAGGWTLGGVRRGGRSAPPARRRGRCGHAVPPLRLERRDRRRCGGSCDGTRAWPGRSGSVSPPGRATDLLVPPSSSGSAARLRAARTESSRLAPSSSARARPTARSRTLSAHATSATEGQLPSGQPPRCSTIGACGRAARGSDISASV